LATTGAWLRTIKVDGNVTCVSFSPTAHSMLATATENDEIHLWDINGEMIRKMDGCSKVAIFSPDGLTIATAGAGRSRDVQLIDAESGVLRFRMVAHECYISCASWCPFDGSKLVSGSGDGTCRVWDSTTGTLLHWRSIGEPIQSVAWGRDWVRDTQRVVAFAMGHHPRLGAESQVLEREAGVVRMILDRV